MVKSPFRGPACRGPGTPTILCEVKIAARFESKSGSAHEGAWPQNHSRSPMDRQAILKKLDQAWTALRESFAGLPESRLTEPGVTGDWSVKDILAHVTTWEEEALKYLPLILAGGRPPQYSKKYGGINAFNTQMTEQKRSLSLSEVLRQLDETHRRRIDYIQSVPEEQFARETPLRHRLRLDTYSHY